MKFLVAVFLSSTIAISAVVWIGARQNPPPSPTREGLILAVDRLLAERWYPADERPKTRPQLTVDQQILQLGLLSRLTDVRQVAVRGLGQFENAADVPTLIPFLQDSNAGVRCEATNAIVMALHRTEGPDVLLGMRALLTPYQPPLPTITRANPSGRGTITIVDQSRPQPPPQLPCPDQSLQAVVRLNYDHDGAVQVLKILVPNPEQDPTGAALKPSEFRPVLKFDPRLLLPLLYRDHTLPIDVDVRRALRLMAQPKDEPQVPFAIAAVEIMGLLQDREPLIYANAATWHCPRGPQECGWDFRIAGLKALDPLDTSVIVHQALDTARSDVVPEVRLIAVRRFAAAIARTQNCEEITHAAWDDAENMMVRIEAVDLLEPGCRDRDAIAGRLASFAADLGKVENEGWRLPMHALETLARFDQAVATRMVHDFAVRNPELLVRLSAARVALQLKDVDELTFLMKDKSPTVRAEALTGLVKLRDPTATSLAIDALESLDDELVIVATQALKGAPDVDAAVVGLFKALKRLTGDGRETSRFARMAIVDRLKDWAPLDRQTRSSRLGPILDDLRGLTGDPDPSVAASLAELLALATGTRPAIYPEHRLIEQPTEFDLKPQSMPSCAVLYLAGGGQVGIGFASDAPLAVLRLTKLAAAGYFDNQPFIYRRRSFETMEAGSPDGNEFSGDVRFSRDELGPTRHLMGAVGLGSHGRDTVDLRFVVDLDAQPAFDNEFTVLGGFLVLVPVGPQFASSPTSQTPNVVLEGGTITGIKIGYPSKPCW